MLKRLCALLVTLTTFLSSTYADTIEWKETRIPMPSAGPNGLEALLVWPNLPGKHPLALISHGSPRDGSQRPEMTAISFLPVAMEFARRGFSVAVVLRRGYGTSDGNWNEAYGTCNAPNYLAAAKYSSEDLHTAINYLGTLPQFDTSKIVAVGVSAGGFATVALTADHPPPGLVAAISFAGGRGSKADNVVCHEEKLIDAFANMGKTSRIPMLWVYANNDHFFNPALAKKLFQAFTTNGGNATLIQPEDFQTEGHFLFSRVGIPQWTPIVDQFLHDQQLVLLVDPLPLPEPKSLPYPAHLSINGKKAFATYLTATPHKAFAIAPDGGFGWRSGRRTGEEAASEAVANCESADGADCSAYAVDESITP